MNILAQSVLRFARLDEKYGIDTLSGVFEAFKGSGTGSTFGQFFFGGVARDRLIGTQHDDFMEGGAGNDSLNGRGGNDHLLSMSWGGEPVPDQDASGQVNTNEPLSDTDRLTGGSGADTFEFRWLIDAKEEILEKHRDATGDVDYSMNGVAGENDNVHDHWVESIGVKIIKDFDASEGDTLIFKGHTIRVDEIEHMNYNNNGVLDTVINFESNQGGAGAHDGDKVGKVVILDSIIEAASVDAGVFYGVEDPYFALG